MEAWQGRIVAWEGLYECMEHSDCEGLGGPFASCARFSGLEKVEMNVSGKFCACNQYYLRLGVGCKDLGKGALAWGIVNSVITLVGLVIFVRGCRCLFIGLRKKVLGKLVVHVVLTLSSLFTGLCWIQNQAILFLGGPDSSLAKSFGSYALAFCNGFLGMELVLLTVLFQDVVSYGSSTSRRQRQLFVMAGTGCAVFLFAALIFLMSTNRTAIVSILILVTLILLVGPYYSALRSFRRSLEYAEENSVSDVMQQKMKSAVSRSLALGRTCLAFICVFVPTSVVFSLLTGDGSVTFSSPFRVHGPILLLCLLKVTIVSLLSSILQYFESTVQSRITIDPEPRKSSYNPRFVSTQGFRGSKISSIKPDQA